MKRFGKGKGNFSILFWLWAETQLEAEPGPATESVFPDSPPQPAQPDLPFRSAARRAAEAQQASTLAQQRRSRQPSVPDPSGSRAEFATNS
jgi:hypothetical protein